MDRIDVAAVLLSVAERILITYAKQHRSLLSRTRIGPCAVADH